MYNYELSWNLFSTYLLYCLPWLSVQTENYITYNLYLSITADSYSVFDTFAESLRIWFYDNFTYFSWDYLHIYYLRKAIYLSIILDEFNRNSSIIKPIILVLPLNIFISIFSTKILYLVLYFYILFALTNLMAYKTQFNFNLYLLYYNMIVGSEKEFSGFDDYYWFLLLFLNIFGWYFLLILLIYVFDFTSTSWISFAVVCVTTSILGIPTSAFLNYGIFFAAYIRGAASSTNLISESIFDLIGVIVVFSRFVIQNIRFVLVFVAFFELFEWVYMSLDIKILINTLTLFTPNTNSLDYSINSSMWYILILISKIIVLYTYYTLHLIILIFMQIGIYFIVSFWLFFFLYTSFIKLTTDFYFIQKRKNI